MKILIYGSRAWIGKKVLNHFINDNIEIVEGNCRVDNTKDLEEEIQKVQPTHIISTIGRTHGTYNGKIYGTIDYLEQPGKLVENVRDNLFSPVSLAIIGKKYNIHVTILSTGCIYTYDEEHPYEEEVNGFKEYERPNFFGSSYSTVKGYTDQLLNFFNDSLLSLRIRMPITSEIDNSRNFIYKIVHYNKICSIKNSMTVLDELIPIMCDMITKNVTGPINFTNPGLISHNEILQMYKEIVDPSFTWNNFTIDEQNAILDSGRSNNYMDTSRLESLYPNVKNIKDSVKDVLIKMSENK
jgi:nucleoside-diphosphate-sugar epimerase